MANNIENLAALRDPPTLLAALFLTGGVCKFFELTRTAVAWGTDKIADSQKFVHPNTIREIASIIGPRDFYAREVTN